MVQKLTSIVDVEHDRRSDDDTQPWKSKSGSRFENADITTLSELGRK